MGIFRKGITKLTEKISSESTQQIIINLQMNPQNHQKQTNVSEDVFIFEKACLEMDDMSKRRQAEQIIQHYLQKPQPYELCRQILERKSSENATFYGSMLLCWVITRECGILTDQLKREIVQFIMNLLLNQSLPLAAVNQLSHSFAIIQKRSWLSSENGDHYFKEALNSLQALLVSGNFDKINLSLKLQLDMVVEFGNLSKASKIGVNWEFHEKSRQFFQKNFLSFSMNSSLNTIRNILTMIHKEQNHPMMITLLISSLSLLVQILCWDFTSDSTTFKKKNLQQRKHSDEHSEHLTAKIDTKDENWKKHLSNPQLLNTLVSLHNSFKENNRISHLTRQCIIQCCSLSSSMFNENERTQYLKNVFTLIFSFARTTLESKPPSGQEIYDICLCLQRVATHFNASQISNIPNSIESFWKPFSSMTTVVINLHAKYINEEWFKDSLDILLEAWGFLILTAEVLLMEVSSRNENQDSFSLQSLKLLKGSSFQVFDSFINMKLSPEMDDDFGEDESVLDDQLTYISNIARFSANESLHLLNSKVCECLSSLQTKGSSNNDALNKIWDHLDFLLSVSGYIIADESKGEKPVIPDCFIQLTLSNQNQNNILIQLCTNLLKLANNYNANISCNKIELLSPQIAQRIAWYLRRWAISYLMPDPLNYKKLSNLLVNAFNGEGGKQITNLLLSYACNIIYKWQGEPKMAIMACALLDSLVDNEPVRRYIISTDIWKQIIQNDRNSHNLLSNQSDDVKREMMKCICKGICGSMEKNEIHIAEQQLGFVLIPLKDQLQNLVQLNGFIDKKLYEHPNVKKEVHYIIEKMRGIAKSSNSANTTFFFKYFTAFHILKTLVKLMNIYHNHDDIVELVLHFFSNLMEHQNTYLNKTQCREVYNECLDIIRIYRKYNAGKQYGSGYRAEAENEVSQSIIHILQMLNHITSKSFIDFDNETEMNSGNVLKIPEIIVKGIHEVLPLISNSMLQFSDVNKLYFKLINFLFSVHPETIAILPPNIFHQIMGSIDFGIKHHEVDIARLSLECIQCMAQFHLQTRSRNEIGFSNLEVTQRDANNQFDLVHHFTSVILNICLFEEMDSQIIDSVATALLGLVFWNKEKYLHIASGIVSKESESKEKLTSCFHTFNQCIQSMNSTFTDRRQVARFVDNFHLFLNHARPLLRRR